MTNVLIGHRGVGKSTLLERLAQYGFHVLDLDCYIEQREGQSIAEIFANHGEPYFRTLEKKYFVEAMVFEPQFVAIGAGFEFDLPKSVNVIWIKRITDKTGRVFLNRPRLDQALAPLEEYLKKYEIRNKRFSEIADQIYELPEGRFYSCENEKNILGGGRLNLDAILTVFPNAFRDINIYFEGRKNWKASYFELRNDLLDERDIACALKYIPAEQLLFSVRRKVKKLPEGVTKFDWALELGECPLPNVTIYSLHTRSGELSLGETLKNLTPFQIAGAHIKLAVEIRSFKELMMAHDWQREHPTQRSFLPSSPDGRWRWYRLLQKGQQKLNFVNDGFSKVLDQPTVMEWLNVPVSSRFGAVLGDPIDHSFSPEEHQKFFSERGHPFVKVRVGESEYPEAINALTRLGLKYAAVTSPLKKIALPPHAVNSLYHNQDWQGANTDLAGLEAVFSVIGNKAVAVWGGGGLLESIKGFLPNAKYYSTNTGENRDAQNPDFLPEVVVWAVGRSRLKCFPPDSWRPQLILDLNYTEDSPGRDYAQRTGAEYQDGIKMFKAQAAAQREFWKKCEAANNTQKNAELR